MSGNSLLLWILLSAVLLAVVAKFYGWKGVLSTVCLAGTFLAKDAVRHFLGRTGEWVFVAIFAIPCIAIYIIKRRKPPQHGRHRHHLKSGRDHVA